MTELRIYVACLAAYNNGKLHGEWIDATLGEDHINEQVEKILTSSPEDDAEEWAIHDHEGFPSGAVNEYSDFGEVAEMAEFIEEHGDIALACLDNLSGIEEAKQAAEDNYLGTHKSLAEYAEHVTRECNDIPDYLDYYIDWESMARDIERGGDVWTAECSDGLMVFSNC